MKEFEVIYDEYFKEVYKFILSLSKNSAIAEDIVQDTFIKALKNAKNLKDSTKIKSWLFQIAKNTYLSYVSKNVKNISIDEIEIASSNNEETEFLNKDTIKRVRSLLHKIKEPYKEVFYLRVFANLSFKEIAEIFEKEETWARQIFHRSKIMIKEGL
ncbi:MAG: RNA polymerase sigma factor [Clostridia bacterium]